MATIVEHTPFIKKEPVKGTLEYLYWKNLHERDPCVSFEEGPHIYTINGKRGESTSVTTWVHSHFPEFDKEKIVNNILTKDRWATDPTYKYYKMSKEEIIKMWDDKTQNACMHGTNLHNNIEKFYNGMDVKDDTVEFKYFMMFKKDFPNLKPYRTEWMVFHEELKLVGSIDMVFENEHGDLEIYDWKRCEDFQYDNLYNKYSTRSCLSHIPDTNYWHYSIQLNTYRQILQLKYGKKVTALYLVRFHPNNPYKTYDRTKVDLLDNEMNQLFEERKKEIE